MRNGRGRDDDDELDDDYGMRDYAHRGAFTGSDADFGEPVRRRGYGPELGPDRGHGGRSFAPQDRSRTSFGDAPETFGMNMPGNFGYDRGGRGLPGASYFGGSDRGRATTASYASGHGQSGGDVDRGFAGNSAMGGTDRDYSGGLNYGWGGNAYRSGLAHDRFDDVRPELRSREQTMRSHRGVGPRNYRRSDERLREIVCERLADDHDVDATDVEVVVENGVVRLSGTVADRWMKRAAEQVAESVTGVSDVDNQLRVGR